MSAPPDLAIKIEVLQFESTTRGTAEVAARWSIERGSDRTPLLTGETSVSEPIRGTDTRAAVAGLSAEATLLVNGQRAAAQAAHALSS